MREAHADQIVDLPCRSCAAATTSWLRVGLVVDGHGREVEARDLARRLHARLDDVLLAERRGERLRGAVQLALLDLGALQLQEHALVLDGPKAEARGLGRDLLLVRREGPVLEAVDGEHPAQRLALEHRDRPARARTGQAPA